ncbi:hypothetical protein GCM10022402_47300 [Salinactinospora qingdaonensis]|uniref:Uncharacterized protein n=1 Tax=Salinactinospora qingdaonensis TaxID=702744 RepID=A0ABP7GJ21_9ACTN
MPGREAPLPGRLADAGKGPAAAPLSSVSDALRRHSWETTYPVSRPRSAEPPQRTRQPRLSGATRARTAGDTLWTPSFAHTAKRAKLAECADVS